MGSKEAVADADDADGEEPTANTLKRNLPVNGVFDVNEGKRDITSAIKAAKKPQFFTSIDFTYTDKDGKTQNQKVPAVLEEIIELPDILRVHKNIEITYLWDIDTIKENTDVDIQDGDFLHLLILKGWSIIMANLISFDEYIKYNGRTIGRFIMTPGADEDTQKVKIIFCLAN